MQRHVLDSSVIAVASYDETQRILQLEFTTGRIYLYFDVPKPTFQTLLTTPSAGQYFNKHIKDRYRSLMVSSPFLEPRTVRKRKKGRK